ncbi:acyltransferase [Streptomyces sp. WAC06614]|uniref:acyltransferase family protein n=1 Tax=Streptomyces sp. WAC06614 TaxID=2487416 RepID=UPI000F79B073|nr:acyltransferase [Streptomyces sp. WAC06614]RSS79383.1 acyltransferase [Streptomyces sp. WAC06614]
MTMTDQQALVRAEPRALAVAERPVARMAWLDVLRGIAALLVALHHFRVLHLLPGGAFVNKHFDIGIYAVMLFFLVSGYIVPASLERKGDVRGFWIGRIFRIYPLLIVVITAAVLVLPADHFAVAQPVMEAPVRSGIANALLLNEMLNVPSALGSMWTLSYEMVFYFLVTALFVQNRHRLSAPIALAFAAAALLLGNTVAAQLITTGPGSTQKFILVVAVVTVAAMACVLAGRTEVTRIGALMLGGLGLLLVLANARAPFFESMLILATMFAGTAIHRAQNGRIDRHVAAVCCAFVLAAGFLAGYLYNRGPNRSQTWTEHWTGFALPYVAAWLTFGLGMMLRHRTFPRVLTWLGRISYSVYVVHIPAMFAVYWLLADVTLPGTGPGRFVPTLIFLVLTLGLSQLTYRYVELPGQRLGKRLASARRGAQFAP